MTFKGRLPAPQAVKCADPACKGAVSGWDSHALIRLTRNAPSGAGPASPVLVEEKGCTYRPALQGAVRGQKILLRNSDGTTHSIRAEASGRTVFNVIQPATAKDLLKDPLVADVVKLSCDLHPWMKAVVVISDHPYFAVTADDGSFEIKDVPAGTYGIEAWNERLGVLRADVVVEDGKRAEAKFTFTVR